MKNVREYSVAEIEAAAQKILNSLYGSFVPTPVDVEYIIEKHPSVVDFDLVKGLNYEHGIEGVIFRLKPDRFAILVDADLADRSPYRYRFTVSEELSHVVLHKDLINEVDSKEKAVKLFADARYRRMDRNAKRFAAALLMPSIPIVEDGENLYHEIVLTEGIQKSEIILRKVIETLRKKYDVSRETMFYRLKEWPLRIVDRIEFSIRKQSKDLLLIE